MMSKKNTAKDIRTRIEKAEKQIDEHLLSFTIRCCQTSRSRKSQNTPFIRVATAYWHWCSDQWLEPISITHLRNALKRLKGASKLILNPYGLSLADRDTRFTYTTEGGPS